MLAALRHMWRHTPRPSHRRGVQSYSRVGTHLSMVCLALVGVGACAKTTQPRAASMATNEVVVREGGLTAELVRAEYQPEFVLLRLELRNGTDLPVSVDPNGTMLAFDGLEYGVHVDDREPRPEPLQLDPGDLAPLDLRYRLGRALSQDARLVLRAVQRGDAWMDPLVLAIPAEPPVGPAAEDPGR